MTPQSQQGDKGPTWSPGGELLHQKPGATMSSKSVDQKMKSVILRSTVKYSIKIQSRILTEVASINCHDLWFNFWV